MPPRLVVERFPETDDELWEFVATVFNVQIPRTKVCEHHRTPFEAFADAYFARSAVSIWKASRGFGGKSYLLALLSTVEMATLGAGVSVLGGSGAQSQNVNKYAGEFWQSTLAPRHLLLDEPGKYEIHLRNGGSLRALLASSRSVRGLHPSRLRLDECLAGDTMVATPDGDRPIGELQSGDLVFTANTGGRIPEASIAPILAVMPKGNRATVTLEFSDGRIITCTPEHKFYTRSGWKAASEIAIGEACAVLHPVRREALRFGSQQDRALPLVLESPTRCLRTSLPRLQKEIDRCQGAKMPGVLLQACGDPIAHLYGLRACRQLDGYPMPGVPVQASWSSKATLPRLRGEAQSGRHAPMQTLLAPVPINDGRNSPHDGVSRAGNEKSHDAVEVRSTVRRTSARVETSIQRTGCDGAIHCGFSAPFSQCNHRGSRGILARQTHTQTTRRAQTKVPHVSRLSPNCFATAGHPPLDANPDEVVRLVLRTTGPIIPVFDISVADHHCFFAEGVLVHNCDEMDLAILDAAQGQPMEGAKKIATQTVMSSTHQYPDGTMTQLLKRAAGKSWPVWTWCWRENAEPHGWLSIAEVDRKRQEVTEYMWDVEYELGEPSTEGRMFTLETLSLAFDPALGGGVGKEGEMLTFEEPQPGAVYATGADWGKKEDWTIIATFRADCSPWRCVAWERLGRRPYPEMIRRLEERCRKYPGTAAHDATGLGTVVEDILYGAVNPVQMVGRARHDMFSTYAVALQQGAIVYPMIEYVYNEHRYCRVDDLYGAGHPPDSLVAGTLAWHVRMNVSRGYGPQAGGERMAHTADWSEAGATGGRTWGRW